MPTGEAMTPPVPPEMVLPKFGAGCISDLVPTIFEGAFCELPVDLDNDSPKALLVLDGLGWEQLQERSDLAPNLSSMSGGAITSVAPSTTSAALTSITTGMSPGEHGVVGYRFVVDGQILNALTWRDPEFKDLRQTVPPHTVQPYEPFLGHRCSYVSKEEFRGSGFTEASWRGSQLVGYRTLGSLLSQSVQLMGQGEEFIYCYYDGIDKVSHEYGFGKEFDAEVAFTDNFVGLLAEALPSGTQLVVTADHGQVDCGTNQIVLDPTLAEKVSGLSGEGRFRWLHCGVDQVAEVQRVSQELYGDVAWVLSFEEVMDLKLFGPVVSVEARSRLGQVALLPFADTAFADPLDTGPFELRGRHGSLTSAEMLVPLLTIAC